jgi:heparin/heparan-sulfate lyase
MHAAWLFRRMTGHEVFDANLKRVPLYWLYMRLPDGEMLRDGDGVPGGRYWTYAQTALLCYAYNRDPILKGEYQRQASSRDNSVLFLLLNDPSLAAEPRLDSLPLTLDFGPILGGMVARTGWHMGRESADVVTEIKGGGYHFGNHQHADAGSFQIYYRGLQVAKLAQYVFYGTPYDLNFAKRSVAQSMMLVVDPQEKIYRNLANDGGTRFIQSNPRTPRQAMTDPTFANGRVQSCSFGPDARTPDFSYFATDLRGAYSEKISAYVRRFCFLNLHHPDQPAAMILLDDLTSAQPEFKKHWQLTTLRPPQSTAAGVRLHNEAGGVTGRLDVTLLLPRASERTLEIVSGPEVHRVGGQLFNPPTPAAPEANGHRIRVSPLAQRNQDTFLAVLQACASDPLPVASEETADLLIVRIADRVVALAKGTELISQPIDFTVPPGEASLQVLLAGLAPGPWRLTSNGTAPRDVQVEPGRNTIHFESQGGNYRLAPVATQ